MTVNHFTEVVSSRKLNVCPIGIETLWINLTRRCNQSCVHCHVDASPERVEEMDDAVIEQCLRVLQSLPSCHSVDITGGAPELHPIFEELVIKARTLGKHVVVRHNLTVAVDGDKKTGAEKLHLPRFFAENGVELLVSLPHFERNLTDTVRGNGVFDKSIDVLRRLNACGYGQNNSGLDIHIVSNCDGPVSPAARQSLESSFRTHLSEKYGIVFNRLFTVTNMPVNRYLLRLEQDGSYQDYMYRLMASFSAEHAANLVCRRLVSVGYDGRLFDCDFNQMMGVGVATDTPMTIFNFDLDALMKRRIQFGAWCFGCTAGGGGS